jgi:hypothetical protein
VVCAAGACGDGGAGAHDEGDGPLEDADGGQCAESAVPEQPFGTDVAELEDQDWVQTFRVDGQRNLLVIAATVAAWAD